jgi:hypothetical protein
VRRYIQILIATAEALASARGWELRAATSLAALWSGQGKAREARDLLAGILGWFTEGADTRDLRDASTFLAQLG